MTDANVVADIHPRVWIGGVEYVSVDSLERFRRSYIECGRELDTANEAINLYRKERNWLEDRLTRCEQTLTKVRDALGWDVDPHLAGCICNEDAPTYCASCPIHGIEAANA